MRRERKKMKQWRLKSSLYNRTQKEPRRFTVTKERREKALVREWGPRLSLVPLLLHTVKMIYDRNL